MTDKMSIATFLKNFDAGLYDANNVHVQCQAGWYDWFCRDTSLANKTKKLAGKLKMIVKSNKIDVDKMGVFFKNNCPMRGRLYDDFRIYDLETGDVIYTVVPESGAAHNWGCAELWGKENNFEEPLVEKSWKDVKAFFKN